MFAHIVTLYCKHLKELESPLLAPLPGASEGKWETTVTLLRQLSDIPLAAVAPSIPDGDTLLTPEGSRQLLAFVEGLYDFWRQFDRFMILHSNPGANSFDKRPYRAFNHTIEALAKAVRSAYRDAAENICGDHPRVYRQVAAGCDVGLIAVPSATPLPGIYEKLLGGIPFVRQVWIAPPMITNPPKNTRGGRFQKVGANPLQDLALTPEEWVCYPAQVGPLVIFVYVHQRFIGLGTALANLFEIASDEQVEQGPHAIYLFGAPPAALARFGERPTVFHEDEQNGLVVAAVPGEDEYGYFGYLKKMILTLHNVVMMRRRFLPFHGALVKVALRGGASANVLVIGDTGTGKSETLEAFRTLGAERIRSLRIVADDMGSIELTPAGALKAYGTEIGAFVRLDDLQQGYAFEQLDRAIFMSPHKVNARVVVPVTTMAEVLEGCAVDYILYANNYESVDEEHPVIEPFASPEAAIEVFRAGAAMSKGTTTATGLVHSYYANVFGPPEYKPLHDELAVAVFAAAFKQGVMVGQIRTRLGIPGFASDGPHAVAEALLQRIEAGR